MDRTRFIKSRTAIFICAFLIPFVMTQIFWAVCGVYPYGDHSILTGDMNIEFVNFYSYFINTFSSKNDWSYMLAKTLGGDFPGLAAFQLHDPLLFVLFLFPQDNIAAGIELVFSLQISFAGLFASVLLNNRYRQSWMSLLFSTGYAFSSFFFGYLVLTIYFGALAVLPLVLYYFLKFLDEGKNPVPFIVTAAFMIFLNYHMGFMLCIFLAVLYISRLISDTSYIRRFFPLALSAVTVILINGFFLVRTGLSLLGEKTTEGADYGFYRRFPMNQLFAGLFAGCARNDLRPLIYCGVAPLLFAVVYFLLSSVAIREKLANLFVIAAVALSMWINTIDAVWHGFNNPEGFYWRYAYYISITVIVLGYKGFISIFDEEEGERKKIRYIIVSAAVAAVYMLWLVIMKNAYMDRMRLVLNAALIAAFTAVSVIMIRRKNLRAAGFALIFVISACEMIYSAKTAYLCLNLESDELPKMSAFKEDYHDIRDVVSYVKAEDNGFYRLEKDFDRGINDPSMFDYIGMSHDSSCEKDAILDWLVDFGFCKTVYYTYYNGGSTSFVDDLFGIKYYISKYDSIEKPYDIMSYTGKYHAYHNADALPMAYVAPAGLAKSDISEGNTFEKQNLLASYWSDEPVYIKTEPEITLEGADMSGPGHYVRTADEGYIVYNIPIEYEMPLYFYFYAPNRQNGEVFVNEESYDAYFTVNHWNTLCAGTFKAGDVVKIRMKMNDEELVITEPCFYYENTDALAAWSEAAQKLNKDIGGVEEITSSHLMFTTGCSNTETVIVSLPYEDAWTVKCDGAKIDTSSAIGMLMSFEVPAGSHVIEMKYTPEGTFVGILLSAAGIIMLVCIFAKGRLSGRKKIVEKVEI